MDSISRYCLLAYLKANPDMTYQEILQFIEGMQPMEVDGVGPLGVVGVHNPSVTPASIHVEGCRGGYGYGYVPDHMG